ncbi:MAG TPA: hypothetical protein VGA62_07905 [Acidimicrobiia bacterium]
MTEVSESIPAKREVASARASGGRRRVSPLHTVAVAFTAMCSLRVSAAVSLSIAAGATFMTRDTTRRPLLAASLTVTVTGSALTYWRHRRAVPLALSVLAAVWVYSFVYVVGAGHGGHMTDHMGTEVHRVFVS